MEQSCSRWEHRSLRMDEMEHRSWSMEAMTWAGRISRMEVLAEREHHSSAMEVTTWVVRSWRRDDVSDAFWPVEVRTIGWDDLAVRRR